MRTKSIDLEGMTYYAESRKCGKASCHCQEGALHGPYWYRRDAAGRVSYVGKVLPEAVTTADRRLALLGREVATAERRLLDQAYALHRLVTRQSLTDADRAAIRDLGFGQCLVAPGDLAMTQDADRAAIRDLGSVLCHLVL